MSELGPTLRALREAAGMTQAGLACRTGYTKAYISLLELGKRRITPEVIDAYDQALREVELHRRSLLTGLVAGAVAPASAYEGIRRGFESALHDAAPHVDDWRAKVERYGRDYMSIGAGAMQARLARDLLVLQTRIDSTDLWAVAARLLTVHGKTLPSADERDANGAVAWYRTAVGAADRSGELDTRVWVRGRAALALAYEGAALPVAATLARQAVALGGPPSLGLLNANMALAHVAAWAGNRPAALDAVTAARRHFDTAGSSDGQASDFAVPVWRWHTFTSMLWSRLGDERNAIAEQDAADRYRPSTLPRFAVHIELHRALMLVRTGDRAGGLAYGRAALDALPPERHSLSLRMMAAEIDAAAHTERPPA